MQLLVWWEVSVNEAQEIFPTFVVTFLLYGGGGGGGGGGGEIK